MPMRTGNPDEWNGDTIHYVVPIQCTMLLRLLCTNATGDTHVKCECTARVVVAADAASAYTAI